MKLVDDACLIAGVHQPLVPELVPEFLEEVYDFPDGNFALFRRRRRIGIGFKTTVAGGGDVRLAWIKLTDLMRFGRS